VTDFIPAFLQFMPTYKSGRITKNQLTFANIKNRLHGCFYDSQCTVVAFIIKNPIDLDLARFVRRDRSSPMKKNAFVRFYHCDASLYPIIPQSL